MSTRGLMLALLLAACAPADRPRIAEIYYDAPGVDTGFEFVELLNPGPAAIPLTGLRLEAGDGSGPSRWSLRWTAGVGDTIRGGGRFVIGGGQVAPAPDASATLDLQNGPDAVRLVWPDGAVEVVGYGAHEFTEYFCGAAASDAASGQSLARIPDASDTGSNAADFRPAAPSPGRANRPRRDAGWVAGTLALAPERPDPGVPALLHGTIANLGAESLAAGETGARVRAGDRVAGALTGVLALGAGESLTVAIPLDLAEAGRQTLVAELAVAGDEAAANDRDSLRVRVGPGPLEVTEIQFHPALGEGEWVEVRNGSGEPLDPASFTLSDRGSSRGAVDWRGGPLAADGYALLAQDRAALVASYPSIDSTRVAEVRPWPSLNNTNDASGYADAVVVREADGVLCDRVDYAAGGVPSGVPLERAADGSWRPALDPRGSPSAPAREPPPLAGAFAVRPTRVAAGGETRLAWSLPWPRARMAIDVYDLAGDRIGSALAETPVAARGERAWNPGTLGPGVYVLRLRARPEGRADGVEVGASSVVRVAGGTR